MPARATTGRLSGCYVISLRPVGGHGAVRRAAARLGARTLALSPWCIDPVADDVASLGLDLLMQDTEYRRAGFDPFLIGY